MHQRRSRTIAPRVIPLVIHRSQRAKNYPVVFISICPVPPSRVPQTTSPTQPTMMREESRHNRDSTCLAEEAEAEAPSKARHRQRQGNGNDNDNGRQRKKRRRRKWNTILISMVNAIVNHAVIGRPHTPAYKSLDGFAVDMASAFTSTSDMPLHARKLGLVFGISVRHCISPSLK